MAARNPVPIERRLLWGIKDVAHLCSTTPDVVQLWVDSGLLSPVAGNLFAPAHVCQLVQALTENTTIPNHENSLAPGPKPMGNTLDHREQAEEFLRGYSARSGKQSA